MLALGTFALCLCSLIILRVCDCEREGEQRHWLQKGVRKAALTYEPGGLKSLYRILCIDGVVIPWHGIGVWSGHASEGASRQGHI